MFNFYSYNEIPENKYEILWECSNCGDLNRVGMDLVDVDGFVYKKRLTFPEVYGCCPEC